MPPARTRLAQKVARTALFISLMLIGFVQIVRPVEAASLDEPLVEEEIDLFSGVEVISVVGEAPDRNFEEIIDIQLGNQPPGDGADLLGELPGFTLIRQGGIGSEPVLRGLGGSRLNIAIDGVPYAGACNHAMDPATTYVNPGELSELIVLRGPQSVRYPGTISGSVDFKRRPTRFDEPGAEIFATGMVGSFDQREGSADVALGMSEGYLRASGGYTESGDYEDGSGESVFSRYDRWNGRLALGWTPGDDTLLEASAEMSDGKMANATIHMDTTKLDRRAFGLRFEKNWPGSWFEGVELTFNRIKVDHDMDDFSMRPPEDPADHFPATAVSSESLIMNQGWEEYSGRAEVHFEPHEAIELEFGFDVRSSDYDARAAVGSKLYLRIPPSEDYTLVFDNRPNISDERRNKIVDFMNIGGYGEMRYSLRPGSKVVAGLRFDRLWTDTGTMRAAGETIDVILRGSNRKRHQDLWSAFLRYEHHFSKFPIHAAIGVGHAERGHDYWEVYSYDGFFLDPERNTEIDVAAYYDGEKLDARVSLFASQIDDFILTYNGVAAFNVKAQRIGGEAVVSYQILPELLASAEIAVVHAKNVTDDVPLAQTPPVEGTIRLRYKHKYFSIGAATRLVGPQHRVHLDYGNRLGVDTDETSGFVVLSMDASIKPWPFLNLSFGIDNLLDNTYHAHLSRQASLVPGFVSQGKVNEPGRRVWLKLSIDLDI